MSKGLTEEITRMAREWYGMDNLTNSEIQTIKQDYLGAKDDLLDCIWGTLSQTREEEIDEALQEKVAAGLISVN